MIIVENYTSGVGVAATKRKKAAMIEVNLKAVNRMLFAVLTLSFIRVAFYRLSIHALIAHFHIIDSFQRQEVPPNLGQSVF